MATHHVAFHECFLLKVFERLATGAEVALALLVLVDLRDLIHLWPGLEVLQLLLVAILGCAATVGLDAEQWVLLGEQPAHVNCLLVVLDLVRLDPCLQVYDSITS